jgi:hypothetical protein
MSHDIYIIDKENKFSGHLFLHKYDWDCIEFFYGIMDAMDEKRDLSGSCKTKEYTIEQLLMIKEKYSNLNFDDAERLIRWFEKKNIPELLIEAECDEVELLNRIIANTFNHIEGFIDRAIELAKVEGTIKIFFY